MDNLSLCSGGGGLDLGLELVIPTLRTVCWVEWEAFAINHLVEAMEAGCLAKAPVWSDLRTFNGKPWRGVVDCLTAGYPCFAAGTHILTGRGYVPIESVVVGDTVLTHLGRWRSVTAVMQREDASLREIRAQGCPKIIATAEHPFYCRNRQMQWDNTARRYRRRFTDPQWQPSRKLTEDTFLAQVLPTEQPDLHSSDFWWLVGRYLACGWLVDRKSRGSGLRHTRKPSGRVVICTNTAKAERLEEGIKAAGFRASKEIGRTAIKYHITQTDFYKFLLPFGRLAHGKRIPGWVFSLPKSQADALLDGYLHGDGSYERTSRGSSHLWKANSTSKSLALSIALLAQRVHGVVASVRYVHTSSTTTIEGRIVNQRPYWSVSIPQRNHVAFVNGQYGWKQVQSNTDIGQGTVFNIAVDEDESYVADGAIVHNCQPFSLAGKRRGTDDPRHLWPHVARIIGEVEPAFVFLENVPGHLSIGFETVVSDLEDLGYEVAAGLFTAAEIGATHKRERLFILANCGCQRRQQERRSPLSNEETDGRTRRDKQQPDSDNLVECQGERGLKKTLGDSFDEGLQGRSLSQCERAGQQIAGPGVGTSLFPPGPDGDWSQVPKYLWPAIEPGVCPVVDGLGTLDANEKCALQALQKANHTIWKEVCRVRLHTIVGAASSRPCQTIPSRNFMQVLSWAAECCEKVGWSQQTTTLRSMRDPIYIQEAASNSLLPVVREPENVANPQKAWMLTKGRTDWLRLLGNGVVPLQAAYAFLSLWASLRCE